MSAELTWLGRLGSIKILRPRPPVHLLDVKGRQCVHYHFTREGEKINCMNEAVRVGRISHGFLCHEHKPRPRTYAPAPPSAWDDYMVDAEFIIKQDKKAIEASKRAA
jgi:hypothetical protein